jgi:hypothetical protein
MKGNEEMQMEPRLLFKRHSIDCNMNQYLTSTTIQYLKTKGTLDAFNAILRRMKRFKGVLKVV